MKCDHDQKILVYPHNPDYRMLLPSFIIFLWNGLTGIHMLKYSLMQWSSIIEFVQNFL